MKRARPLADLVVPVLGPALAAQGFTGSDLLSAWPDVVGERLAAASQPLKVEWPRRRAGEETARRPEPGTLVVRVEGAFAIEFQHLAPLLIERINAVYGWRCIGRVVLKQGRVVRPAVRIRRERISAARERDIADATAAIADVDLEAALRRLGRGVSGADPGLPPAA